MRKFYIINKDNSQEGPFTIEELRLKNISVETPIWYDGIDEWTIAGKIDELKEILIRKSPPKFEKSTQTFKKEPRKRKKANNFLPVIGVLLLVSLFAYQYISSNNDGSSYGDNGGSYEDKKMSVEEIERSNPVSFLDATGTYQEGLFGKNMKVDGRIANSATVVSYKDVEIEIIYYSETNTKLGSDRFVIYDVFPSNTTKSFEVKVKRPKACRKLGWEVVNAKPY